MPRIKFVNSLNGLFVQCSLYILRSINNSLKTWGLPWPLVGSRWGTRKKERKKKLRGLMSARHLRRSVDKDLAHLRKTRTTLCRLSRRNTNASSLLQAAQVINCPTSLWLLYEHQWFNIELEACSAASNFLKIPYSHRIQL